MKEKNSITTAEILKAFEQCNSELEVIRYFGRKNNGASWRFIEKIKKQAGIDGKYYKNRITREEYEKKPRYCETCGKKLTYEQRFNKFCSSSCAAKYNNVIRGPRSLETRIKISKSLGGNLIEEDTHKKCANCGKPIKRGQFCSNACHIEYERKKKIERWLQGENFTRGAGGQLPEFIKKYLLKIHNNKCEKCGWGKKNETTGKIPLEVHHIDGDCTNNKLENLQLLCPNCHSLTPNFGSLNKDSKRFHRKKLTINDIKNN